MNMEHSPNKINLFLFFKLPAAFWCGVRAKSINAEQCTTQVRHRWINQNPFKSMYFAVQAMAAELSTGALVMYHIRKSGYNISMLVANNKATYLQKATGKITFVCNDGALVAAAIQTAVVSGEGQTVWMQSIGTNESGEIVSETQFEWTIKLKNQR
jgi:hypothetical protein